MTALKEFERLEATGLWRPNTAEQRREVVVSLGDATLTITDVPGRVLAHWSLAAVVRSNGTAIPAIYHPDGDPGETLELGEGEDEMINGIDRLLKAIERRRPHPGKLRLVLGTALVLGLVAGTVLWLPDALRAYTAKVVPPVKRAEIGIGLLKHMTRVTGQPCLTPEARPALQKLARHVLGPERADSIIVVPGGVVQSAHLPGGIVVLNKSIIEDFEDPSVPAGYALVEDVKAAETDPLAQMLAQTSLMTSLKLVTTGQVPDDTLKAYAEDLLTEADSPPAIDATLAAFQRAALSSSAYAYAKDLTGESTLPLIEGDPMAGAEGADVLSDGEWLRLQSICE
ncbi:hypothetical protein TRP8649_01583 [Pelagimonas phthalicica]|uniref:Uncharacterized protein n=1 Tax=Pelagimonas phthalicica TaxID=1037362 RepID=A0A238J9Y6_9RHOB|nr:hypothetical protein [Pelagimonas phthalicica]TDS93997.1 hypothetical protein CLV87_0490 [Pelagimonas phthalicica]SMX27478.1 hypothetical protein TRP8649_01583 [Pelagimonas phthalicica]